MTPTKLLVDGTGSATHSAIRSEDTRRTNLSLVLSILHHGGVRSRAELTRVTALNRSTVASLIGELSAAGLAFESAATASNQIGRPSPNVHPSASVVAVAVNPEVDAVTVGLVGLGGEIIRRVRHETGHVPTPHEVARIVAAIVGDLRSEFASRLRLVGVGIAVPGLTRSEVGVVTNAPRLNWHDEPIAALVSEATGLRAAAANDASLGASAAFHFGGGRGVENLVYLHGGASGIGGGIIGDGTLTSGADGYAGQLGHTLVRTNGLACHCGSRGCLETEVTLAGLQSLVGMPGSDVDHVERALRANWSDEVDSGGFAASGIPHRDAPERGERVQPAGDHPRRLPWNAVRVRGRPDTRVGSPGEPCTGRARSWRSPARSSASDLLMIGAAELAFTPLLADPLGSIEGAIQ